MEKTPFGFMSLDSAIPQDSGITVQRFTKDGLSWSDNIILDWKRRSPEGNYDYLLSRYFQDGRWKFSLPYDEFTLETYSDVGLVCCIYVVRAHLDGFVFSFSTALSDGNWSTLKDLFYVFLSSEGKVLIKCPPSADQEGVKEVTNMLLDRIHYFNSCPSDPLLKVHVPSDENMRKNIRRANDKKKPVFEFKIAFVNNEPMIPRRPYQGGTHASPTMHLRRGHFRRHKDTKIWVESCVVGLAKDGITIKAYHVS